MSKPNVLIVEDEPKLAQLLADYFHADNLATHCIYHGDEVMPWLTSNSPDAILLDVMLPGKDGLSLCKLIRERSAVPVLMVTARVEEIDRLLGLELGADDYICKPFSPKEVVARVKAVLRRVNLQIDANVSRNLSLDESRLTLVIDNNEISLTLVEFQLLKPMLKEQRRIFSRQQLMNSMYADNRVVSDRTIDSHIKKLRKKLDSPEAKSISIQSIYGVGYSLHVTP